METKFEDEELSGVIYKTLEVFNTIKDTRLKLYDKVLSIEDKKILSLIQGVLDTNNRIGDRLNKGGFNYGIMVRANKINAEDYDKIYSEYFHELLINMHVSEDMRLEDFLYGLINNPFFIELNKSRGLSLTSFKDVLYKSKVKTLQKDY